MFTKDSSFYNFLGSFETKPSIIEYRKSLMREQYIKLNKNTRIENDGTHHHAL
ncbi:hypothetical protein HZI73_22705 [Vallitalea pronyensis]|uniref:Uncharacterized protein n=1 Tax=Vallitalea pronyensis TaxID=1348613 RepID=A0A8J8MNV1_9FIRM|nr:hypothetical protein [Vallitalea pronyensis]QUI24924.1 hypothetical protein HZI73_22705 [Vallitalea pronyensis]